MYESTEVRIHYRNASSKGIDTTNGVYMPDDLAISDDSENTLTFSWLLSSATTRYIGYLHFSVQFVCLNGETIEYAWNTGVYKDVTVIESINNTEEVVVAEADAITALRNDLMDEVGLALRNAGNAIIVDVVLLANEWVGDVSPYSQVVEIAEVTENSQVDLTPSVEQLAIFHNKDFAFVTENVGGVVTVYAIGEKPENDYTIQATITEVVYE
jgi:hypothetical protein